MTSMTMTYLVLVAYLLISPKSSISLVKGDEALIEKTWRLTLQFDLCMRTVKSNPESQTADVRGLATISTNQTILAVDEARTFPSGLIGGSGPALWTALTHCSLINLLISETTTLLKYMWTRPSITFARAARNLLGVQGSHAPLGPLPVGIGF